MLEINININIFSVFFRIFHETKPSTLPRDQVPELQLKQNNMQKDSNQYLIDLDL